MPQYRAKAPGFMFGRQYGPGTKREVVTTDKPLKPVPSWLEPIKHKSTEDEQAAIQEQAEQERAEQEQAEQKQAEARKQESQVTFTDPGVNTDHRGGVENL